MKELRYTLLTDGSSDRALLPLLTWLLREHGVNFPIQSEWADLRRLPKPPKELSERIKWSIELYPCDLLFVHRDAETGSLASRVEEIHKALEQLAGAIHWNRDLTVCVIPIRMQEAWLLLNEAAIRSAAGNPNGRRPLELPSIKDLEQLPNPKMVLFNLLRQASELYGRRLRSFRVSGRVQRVAEFINDFVLLRALSAFVALEEEIEQVVRKQGWV
ncbi:MAG: hypothetical protein HY268_27845 [Deltaproteobacteria bacterium]|nr:hypothetical protein [Deltaproteobacteria bacterium]